MPMLHTAPRVFAVLRVCDSEICFIDQSGSYAPLTEETMLFDSREDAYQTGRKSSGLVVAIGWKLAELFELPDNPLWAAQRAAESNTPEPVRSTA